MPYLDGGLADPASRALSVLITLVSVGSRGKIRLRSTDPRHKPSIDPSYLSDLADLDPLVKAVGMAREFAAARPLSRQLKSEMAPGPDVRSDADLREWIRGNLSTIYHPVGTCAMGGDSRLAASKLTSVRRHRAAGARRRGPARRGRFGDADRAARQHQRAHDRDRRAGCRPDPGPGSARRHWTRPIRCSRPSASHNGPGSRLRGERGPYL